MLRTRPFRSLILALYPECLHCARPIRRVSLQRQGWMHDYCVVYREWWGAPVGEV
jgi:hypothetical protein